MYKMNTYCIRIKYTVPYITFKQWTRVDRSELITKTKTVADYIEILIAQLVKSTIHSQISKKSF